MMEKKEFLSSLVEHALEMVLVFDEKGVLTYANAEAREKLGYGEGAENIHISNIFPMLCARDEEGFPAECAFGQKTENMPAYRKNQTCFPVEAKVVRDGDGQYVCMASDILEKEFLSKEIAKVRYEAEEAMKVKSEFVANVTHELRTPVNGILGNVRELLEGESDSGKLKNLHLMERCCENMGMIINNILDFSKLEAGKFTLDPQRFHFKNMLDYVKDSHIRRITEKGLDFVVSMSDDIPEYLIGDELRIVQILNNLINNAMKFTSIGRISVEVMKTAQVNDKIELFFFVMDTGIGIDKKDEDKLFQSFSQVDASISRQYGGTGLGLNICKQLVELMGGTIEVESEKGKGSIFSFSIWVTVPEGEEMPTLSDFVQGMPSDFNRRRLMQDEDENDIRRYGSEANKDNLKRTLSKLILCVEMENWEKAEMFADTVKQLTGEAPREVKSTALRLKMAVQKENYEKASAAYDALNALIDEEESEPGEEQG